MWLNLLLLSVPMACSALAVYDSAVGRIPPDHGSFTWDDKVNQLPLDFNLTDSQHKEWTQLDGSFWANAYIKATNGRKFYLASHALDYRQFTPGGAGIPAFRAALLDLTDPNAYYHNTIQKGALDTPFWGNCGEFKAIFDDYGMEAASPNDPLRGIRTYIDSDGLKFDFTFNFSSAVFLNAALGGYRVGGGIGYEWSLPRGEVSGTLTHEGEEIEIDSKSSFVWFDRQWGPLQPGFQWIMVHFEESDWLDMEFVVNWDWVDPIDGPKEFATVRNKKGVDYVIPLIIEESKTNVYVSPETGLRYPQEWTVYLDDGLELLVTSPRPDQIFEAPEDWNFPKQFSGYVDVVAKQKGRKPVKGFGSIDFIQPFPDLGHA